MIASFFLALPLFFCGFSFALALVSWAEQNVERTLKDLAWTMLFGVIFVAILLGTL